MPRIKKIEIDGAVFAIAPLVVEEVEEYVNRPVGESGREMFGMLPVGTYDLVRCGLNNALASDAPPWTNERIRKELDLVSIKRLQDEIVAFSGLKLIEAEPGEARAAA